MVCARAPGPALNSAPASDKGWSALPIAGAPGVTPRQRSHSRYPMRSAVLEPALDSPAERPYTQADVSSARGRTSDGVGRRACR